MTIDFTAFLDSLKYMGFGLAGIFGIIAILIILVNVLIRVFPDKSKKADK